MRELLGLGGVPDRHALTQSRSARSQGPSGPWLRRFCRALLLAAGSAATLAAPAVAHEDGTMSIAVTEERLPPGGALPITGVDFLPGEVIELVLTGPGGSETVGTVSTEADGHFAVVLQVPPSAEPGTYTVDAVSRSGIMQRALFTVDPGVAAPQLTLTPVASAAVSTNIDPSADPVSTAVLAAVGALGSVTVLVVAVLRWRRDRGGGADRTPTAAR